VANQFGVRRLVAAFLCKTRDRDAAKLTLLISARNLMLSVPSAVSGCVKRRAHPLRRMVLTARMFQVYIPGQHAPGGVRYTRAMSNSMRVGVIGTGYVGLVTATCLAEAGHHLTCVDKDRRKIQMLCEGRIPIYEPGLEEIVLRNMAAGRLRFSESTAEATCENDLLFIAVGTPGREDGTADLSAIEEVSREIAANLPTGGTPKIVVEKSTVPVNTGERVKRAIQRGHRQGAAFEVVSNPEFLREGSAIADFFRPDRIVVGVESEFAALAMRRLYEPILEGRYFDPPGSRRPVWLVTDVASAELIKHASNSFLALKISYINAIAAICEATGGNIEHVAEGMGLDHRIGLQFLRAGLGYGGSCFPKDVAAFREIARAAGGSGAGSRLPGSSPGNSEAGAPDFGLLREVMDVNAAQRRRFLRKIEEALWVVKGKTVAVLGLAFKPNTDDIREAPALDVLQWLEKQGAHIRAYDPAAAENARKLFPGVTYCDSPYHAAEQADAVVIVTEWDEFRHLDLNRLRATMHHAIIVDGRNIFSPALVSEAGFEYYSFGRRVVHPVGRSASAEDVLK
jgi:UDPglucose 6-dehydrogenase